MKGLFQRMLKSGMERASRSQKLDARSQKAEVPERQEGTETGYVICDGCTTIDARCVKHCLTCPVRCCAMETGVAHCAHCTKYPCERPQGIWKVTVFKDAQPRLEKLRAGRRSV